MAHPAKPVVLVDGVACLPCSRGRVPHPVGIYYPRVRAAATMYRSAYCPPCRPAVQTRWRRARIDYVRAYAKQNMRDQRARAGA